jgi:16S rRNA (uracil1498-N3)-methyltransferase
VAHFYLAPTGSRLIAGETIVLTGDEARHAAKAARLRVGERILVGDGRGAVAQAEASQVDATEVHLVVVSVTHTEADTPGVWLVQSLAKSGRDEQAIEAATEVGVAGVIPLHAERCVARWKGDKLESGVARWQRIVTEASKQAIQAHTPQVLPVLSTSDLAHDASSWQLIVLDHRAEARLADVELDSSAAALPVAVVVGPEGGFSEAERESFQNAGATVAKMGPGVLRTSSAGPIAIALIHQRLGHW